LETGRPLLLVIDGAKALRRALTDVSTTQWSNSIGAVEILRVVFDSREWCCGMRGICIPQNVRWQLAAKFEVCWRI
jgi:hypothetical protein